MSVCYRCHCPPEHHDHNGCGYCECAGYVKPPKSAAGRHGFYVASRASIPERGAIWRLLRAAGTPINSSWIDEDGDGRTDSFSELWSRIESEVKSAEALVLYVEPEDFPLKGALIEAGMALAFGVPVRIVAPGVKLDPRSARPLGSWINHPLVTMYESVAAALVAAREGRK